MDSRDVIAIPISNECKHILNSGSYVRRIRKSRNLQIMDLVIEQLPRSFGRFLKISFKALKSIYGFLSFVADLVRLRPEVSCNQGVGLYKPGILEGRIPFACVSDAELEKFVGKFGWFLRARSSTRVPEAIDQWILQESPRGDSKR